MTRDEWDACDDPARMLDWLTRKPRLRREANLESPHVVSDRKLRLWACACCRQVWRLLTDKRSRRAVEVAERFADGLATEQERLDADGAATDACNDDPGDFAAPLAMWVCETRLAASGHDYVWQIREMLQLHHLSGEAMAALLRDIIDNPFRPLRVSRECGVCNGRGKLTWQDIAVYCKECLGDGRVREPWVSPTVLALAEAAYRETGRRCENCQGDGRGWGRGKYTHLTVGGCPDCHGSGRQGDGTLDAHRLAVLADALEEAGCADEAILRHLRGEEWHPPRNLSGSRMPGGWIKKRAPCVRGCHVVDAILGRS